MKESYSFKDGNHPYVHLAESLDAFELVLVDANVFDHPGEGLGKILLGERVIEGLDRYARRFDVDLERWGWHWYTLEGQGYITPEVKKELGVISGILEGSQGWFARHSLNPNRVWNESSPLGKVRRLSGVIKKCYEKLPVYQGAKRLYSSVTDSEADHSLVGAALDFYARSAGKKSAAIVTKDLDVIRIFAAYQRVCTDSEDLRKGIQLFRPLSREYWRARAIEIEKIMDEFPDDRIIRRVNGTTNNR
ncbi:MAG: hypothetical protein WC595_06980 [Candidatus Nanoarchaeia archaeon]